MISRLSIKTVLTTLVVLAILWLVLPLESDEHDSVDQVTKIGEAGEETLVSAIQPLSDAKAESLDSQGVVSGSLNFRDTTSALNDSDLVMLKRRFDESNIAIDKGQLQQAIIGLEALTTDFPSVIEPYLNLASVYAEQQQLEKARLTLLKGFDANPKAGLLFDHLKKVHGALAANSYRQALDTKSSNSAQAKLTLTRASNIVTQQDKSKQIAALEKQLQDRQSQANASLNEAQVRKVSALEVKLSELEAATSVEKTSYEEELSVLKRQLADQSQALSQSQTSERDALARVVRAEQEASTKVAEIAKELELQKSLLSDAQSVVDQQSSALAKAQQQSQSQALALRDAQNEVANIRRERDLAAQTSTSTVVQVDDAKLTFEARERQAIDLVQSWARSWSAQDVPAYVSHYADNYSSSRSITRAQWLEQRRIRLTNKEFIRVNVNSFKVKDLGSQFSVTFSQYYQSNTVDDTVTKRLIFDKNTSDWSKSKIVNERLVSG